MEENNYTLLQKVLTELEALNRRLDVIEKKVEMIGHELGGVAKPNPINPYGPDGSDEWERS